LGEYLATKSDRKKDQKDAAEGPTGGWGGGAEAFGGKLLRKKKGTKKGPSFIKGTIRDSLNEQLMQWKVADQRKRSDVKFGRGGE